MSDSRRAFLERVLGASTVLGLPLVAERPAARPPWPAAGPVDERFWRDLKSQFVFPASQLPMNSANMCPAPRAVVEAVERATRDVDADVSYQNRAKYNELREAVRSRIARLLGVTPEEIAIVRNASEANNIVVGGMPLQAGDEVVLLDQNHPTNNVAWDVRAARFGFLVKRVGFPTPPSNAAEVIDRMAAPITARTKVLAFSDVSNSSGLAMPTAELCRLGRARGIHVHVDGAQTFGAARRNLAELGCDSYSASGQKWVLGPREIGILYVRAERIASMWPGVIGVGWGAGAEPSVKGAGKFETLGQRNDASTAGLAAAIEFHERLGPAVVEARVRELGTRLYRGLAEAGFELQTPRDPALRLGVVVVAADPAKARDWHERLYRTHGVIGSNTGGLRLSPTICSTLEDVDRAVEALRSLG
ncbi:MAG: aminotransferase class V-fold PLP-dependent enzyme [Gemmatimonadetes bacterium]|nr:aminotransferase class V-fold PLP-dependent enzyme [Gemmatimonadota bacterium]